MSKSRSDVLVDRPTNQSPQVKKKNKVYKLNASYSIKMVTTNRIQSYPFPFFLFILFSRYFKAMTINRDR